MEIQHRILVEIYTENPMQEMWLYASDLETTLGVKELLKKKFQQKNISYDDNQLEHYILDFIYSFRQAKEYYLAASTVGNLTKPLLLFYGMQSLSRLLILTCFPEEISKEENQGHGITDVKQKPACYSFPLDKVTPQGSGAFILTHRAISDEDIVGHHFTTDELMAIIPELQETYQKTYEKTSKLLKVQFDAKEEYPKPPEDYIQILIPNREFEPQGFGKRLDKIYGHIPRLQQIKEHHPEFELFRVGDYTIAWWKPEHLDSHYSSTYALVKRGVFGGDNIVLYIKDKIELPQITAHYLLMYTLAMLSRYHPRIWGEILNGAQSRDIHAIAKFIQICERKYPNMILNELLEEEIVFKTS